MPIFRCSKCGCVENTATSGYWWGDREDRSETAMCSQCDPAIGKWHGRFPKQSAKGFILCSDGFLYTKEDVASEHFKWRTQHQGLVAVREITE
jgi:hypothetical protein